MHTIRAFERRSIDYGAATPRTRTLWSASAGLLALLTGLLALALPPVTRAQTILIDVNSTLDQIDVDLADDICDADPGPDVRCTLRAAVMQANVTNGEHVIRLQPVLYRLTIPGARENVSETGDLDLLDTITIRGSLGSDGSRTTVDANGLGDRVFDVHVGVTATLDRLVISGGAQPTTASGAVDTGGGIQSSVANLTVLNSTVRNNRASLGGGGIATSGGSLTIIGSTIANNTTVVNNSLGGGGIWAFNSRFSLTDSAVEGNSSGGIGGGMALTPGDLPGIPVDIQRSLIAANNAKGAGGGLFLSVAIGGAARIDNSTISGNRSDALGGAIRVERMPQSKPLVLRASTIAGNRTVSGSVGGIDAASAVSATNVVFHNNLGGNCPGVVFEDSRSNISSDDTCRFFGLSLSNTSARLGPLQFNGGPTRTHMLLPGSPAIDGGTSYASIAIEQRGRLRLAESRPGGSRFDVGAVEVSAAGVGEFTMTGPASALADQSIVLDATWTHPVNWRNLSTVEMQLRSEEALAARVVFTEGITDTAGISVTDGLALYNSDGSIAGVGVAGEAAVLESDTALLDLAATTLRGSGPEGKNVDLSLALRIKSVAAGRVYTTTVLAGDDSGLLQGPHDTGHVAIGPFRSALPLVIR